MPTITGPTRRSSRHSSRHAQASTTIHTKLNHVSRSGMVRVIDLYVIEDNELRRITWLACKATATTYNESTRACAWTGAAWIWGSQLYHLGRTAAITLEPLRHAQRSARVGWWICAQTPVDLMIRRPFSVHISALFAPNPGRVFH